ncbi:MAG: phage portal protein [Planctomycetota bacterium]
MPAADAQRAVKSVRPAGGGTPVRGRRLSVERDSARMMRALKASYAAAQTLPHQAGYWDRTNSLSAAAEHDEGTRRLLRERARLLFKNNSYMAGMIRTLANDCVGTGPRLQVMPESDRPGARRDARRLEQAFAAWAYEVQLAEKLRICRQARGREGEIFAVQTTDASLRHPVKLGVRLIETDQCETPDLFVETPTRVSGIDFDGAGNPSRYHFLVEHPGSNSIGGATQESRVLPAGQVAHYYSPERPDDRRGVPEITPAMNRFAGLHRWIEATLANAENAASIFGVLEQSDDFGEAEDTKDPNGDDIIGYDPMETVDFEFNTIMTLPRGVKFSSHRADQPSEVFAVAVRMFIQDVARCLNMPRNIAEGNSADYNYASGRLDLQTYHRAIQIERSLMARRLLWPIFAWFMDEARLVGGLIPARYRRLDREMPRIEWRWDAFRHVDPQKEAAAQGSRLENGTTTLAREFSEQGEDWEEQLEQIARERDRKEELGLGSVTIGGGSEQEEADDETEEADA